MKSGRQPFRSAEEIRQLYRGNDSSKVPALFPVIATEYFAYHSRRGVSLLSAAGGETNPSKA